MKRKDIDTRLEEMSDTFKCVLVVMMLFSTIIGAVTAIGCLLYYLFKL